MVASPRAPDGRARQTPKQGPSTHRTAHQGTGTHKQTYMHLSRPSHTFIYLQYMHIFHDSRDDCLYIAIGGCPARPVHQGAAASFQRDQGEVRARQGRRARHPIDNPPHTHTELPIDTLTHKHTERGAYGFDTAIQIYYGVDMLNHPF